MTPTAKPGIYVYQPLGPTKANPDRIFGIAGLPAHFTRDEADAVVDALNDICWMANRCALCGHRFRFESSACPQCSKPVLPPWQYPDVLPELCECERCKSADPTGGQE